MVTGSTHRPCFSRSTIAGSANSITSMRCGAPNEARKKVFGTYLHPQQRQQLRRRSERGHGKPDVERDPHILQQLHFIGEVWSLGFGLKSGGETTERDRWIHSSINVDLFKWILVGCESCLLYFSKKKKRSRRNMANKCGYALFFAHSKKRNVGDVSKQLEKVTMQYETS